MVNHPNRRKACASVGSISQGTLLTADLVEAFSWELAHVGGKTKYRKLICDCDKWLETDEDDRDDEIGNSLVSELGDVLNEYAPAYCYFGSHENDGAAFGFWPSMDAIDELPRIEDCDGALARKLGEDCAYVNDHGNVTVYNARGRELLELV